MNYSQALQQISRTLHDVVLWELDRDGFKCQCTCPACSVGICLCSIAGRGSLDDAWKEAGQFYEPAPIYVQQPKQNSPAAQAGLQRGQIITAVADQELETWFDLFKLLKDAKSGEQIQLNIRQESGALDVITTVLAMRYNTVPPTINYETPDPECDLDYCPNKAQVKEIRNALVINRGRGGINCALVLEKE